VSLAVLSATQAKALTTAQIDTLTSADVRALSAATVAGLSAAAIVALTTAAAQGLTSAQVKGLTTAQLTALEAVDFAELGTASLAVLSATQAKALTAEQIAKLDSADVKALSATSVASLSADSVAALQNAAVTGLTAAQLMALAKTAGKLTLTASQAGALTTSQQSALTTAQLMTLTSDAVTPIVLDLNGDGVSTLSVDQGVRFDLAATGTARQTGWVSATDGLLVRDLNGDGVINDGRELFGSATQVDGQAAGDGFTAMRALDSNQDGRLTAADAAFAELAIWKDADQDGVTDAGELVSLADQGVVALNLSAQASTATDNGNLLGLVSSYETTDGGTHDLVDVWFRQGDPDALRNSVTELTQSLGSYLETDAVESGATASLSPTTSASTASPALAMAVQLETYYSLQAVTGVNPVAQGATAVNSLLSGGVTSAPATALLASSDSVKAK